MDEQAFDKLGARSSTLANTHPSLLDELIVLIPKLRAFARMLCGERELSEDLAQKTLAKALRAHSRIEPGANMKICLFGIFHDEFHSHMQPDGCRERLTDSVAREAQSRFLANETARKLLELPASQREALILVTAAGLTYEDTARICGTQVVAVKSLVAHARGALLRSFDGDAALS
jgi:RNA polymerase sigma-70 factor, ECF subfamily